MLARGNHFTVTGQALEDRPTGRVGKGPENIVRYGLHGCNHKVKAQRPPGGERLTHHVGVQTLHNRKSQSLWAVRCSVVSGRSFRNKSSKDMALPHPKSRKDNCRKEDQPNSGGVLWNLFKRTINITEYRNAKDDVKPAKNRAFGGITHHPIPFH